MKNETQKLKFDTKISNTDINFSENDFDFRPKLSVRKVKGHIKYIKKLTPKFDFD